LQKDGGGRVDFTLKEKGTTRPNRKGAVSGKAWKGKLREERACREIERLRGGRKWKKGGRREAKKNGILLAKKGALRTELEKPNEGLKEKRGFMKD